MKDATQTRLEMIETLLQQLIADVKKLRMEIIHVNGKVNADHKELQDIRTRVKLDPLIAPGDDMEWLK